MNLKKKIIVNNPWIEEEWVKFLLIYTGNQFTTFVAVMVYTIWSRDFPCGSDGKESACSAGEQSSIPGLGRSSIQGNSRILEYSSILAWRILWTEEPGELQSMVSQRVRHDWATDAHTHTHTVYTVTWDTQLMNTELELPGQIQV